MEYCLFNTLFRKLLNAQATVVMCYAVNYNLVNSMLHTGYNKRDIFKTNVSKVVYNHNTLTELINLQLPNRKFLAKNDSKQTFTLKDIQDFLCP